MNQTLGLAIIAAVVAGNWCFSVTDEKVESKLRILGPALMMAEDIFRLEDTNNCLEIMFCLLETTEREIGGDNPLKHFSRFLTNTHNDFDETAAKKFSSLLQKFPHFSKMVDAIVTGQNSNNSSPCNMTYSVCRANEEKIISIASQVVTDLKQSTAHRKLTKR